MVSQNFVANGSQNIVPQPEPRNLLERLILWPHPISQQQALKSENLCLNDGHQNQYTVMIITGIARCFIYGKMPGPHLRPMDQNPRGEIAVGHSRKPRDYSEGGMNLSHHSNLTWLSWDQQPLPSVTPQQCSSLLGLRRYFLGLASHPLSTAAETSALPPRKEPFGL